MTVDLTGGIDEDREYVFATRPDDPEMRESVNVWLWEDDGTVGMPRIGVEAVADQWDTHDVQCNIAVGGGRLLTIFEPGPVHDPRGADGRPRVLGAGPLRFELVEPFVHWRMEFDGAAVPTSVQAQIAGDHPEPDADRVPVSLELDLRAAVPPWENGTLRPEAATVLAEQEEGALMGGPRFEQLFRAEGTFTVDGETRPFRGGGLRIRRAGVRRLARFWGHAWASAVFPSGRAFGHLVYPPRDDGLPTYNEGFVFTGAGALRPARVETAPWLRRLRPDGEEVRIVLDTDDGPQEIVGETLHTTVLKIPVTSDMAFPILQQCIVRYTWQGETANGMLERSSLPDQVERD